MLVAAKIRKNLIISPLSALNNIKKSKSPLLSVLIIVTLKAKNPKMGDCVYGKNDVTLHPKLVTTKK